MSTGHPIHIGNLLLEAQRRFRQELITRANDDGYGDLRIPHLHVFGNIDAHGTRLTELAARAGLGPSAMLEMVDDLEHRGGVIRKSAPTDRRAKLVTLTDDGLAAMRRTRALITAMEAEFAETLGVDRYQTMRAALAALAAPG